MMTDPLLCLVAKDDAPTGDHGRDRGLCREGEGHAEGSVVWSAAAEPERPFNGARSVNDAASFTGLDEFDALAVRTVDFFAPPAGGFAGAG